MSPNLVPLPEPSDFPSAAPAGAGTDQQQIEESVVPREPLLQEPKPAATPYPAEQAMQELERAEAEAGPKGPSAEEIAKQKIAFRKLTTAVQLDPEIQALKEKALAMKTERDKRAWLRVYYREYERKMVELKSSLGALAQSWDAKRQGALARPRTEEGVLPPGTEVKYPGGYANRKAPKTDEAGDAPTPDSSQSILPAVSATPGRE